MAGSFDAGRSPTSDKTNDCLGLPHGEGNAILKCSLVEHCHERILAADCDEVPWQLISRRGILRSAARGERSVTAYWVHSPNQPPQHSLSVPRLPWRLHCIAMQPFLSVLARKAPATWSLPARAFRNTTPTWKLAPICLRCRLQQRRQFTQSRRLTDQGNLLNVDHPAKLVRVNQKHGPGLIIIGTPIPRQLTQGIQTR